MSEKIDGGNLPKHGLYKISGRDLPKQKLYLVFDVECTGLSFGWDRIFEISILVTDGSKILRSIHEYIRVEENLLNIAIENIGHKIKIDKVLIRQKGRMSRVVFTELDQFFKDITEDNPNIYLVGHHVSFDYRAFIAEFNLNSIYSSFESYFRSRQIDTLILAKKLLPNLKRYSLDFVAESLGFGEKIRIRNIEGHSANYDTEITFDVFKKLYKLPVF